MMAEIGGGEGVSRINIDKLGQGGGRDQFWVLTKRTTFFMISTHALAHPEIRNDLKIEIQGRHRRCFGTYFQFCTQVNNEKRILVNMMCTCHH